VTLAAAARSSSATAAMTYEVSIVCPAHPAPRRRIAQMLSPKQEHWWPHD
jgi:hypothetical protein